MENLYSIAVGAIQRIVDEKLTSLQEAHEEARAQNLLATRAALRGLVSQENPLRPVAELLASSLTIGREDGYPYRQVSEEAKKVWTAAMYALNGDGKVKEKKGIAHLQDDSCQLPALSLSSLATKEQEDDFKAWDALRSYKKAQTVQKL
jgi:hypothetical protein